MAANSVTTAEAARILGVSVRRIQQMIADDVLTAQKAGRDWMLDRAQVHRVARKPRPRGRPRKQP